MTFRAPPCMTFRAPPCMTFRAPPCIFYRYLFVLLCKLTEFPCCLFEVMPLLTHSSTGTSNFGPHKVVHVECEAEKNYSKLSRLQQLHAFAVLPSREISLSFSNEVAPGQHSGQCDLST